MDLSNIDVLDFLEALDIRNVSDGGEEVQFSCPFSGHSHGDENASAYMNTSTTAFYCHGCKKKGNAVYFLAALENISPLLAARYIRERYDNEFAEPTDGLLAELERSWAKEKRDTTVYNPPIKYSMDPLPQGPLDYMIGRGFDESTLKAWQIGYDKISDRVAIPIRNENGELVGYKGRAYKSEHKPKYLVLGDRSNRPTRYGFKTYEVSRVVFGLSNIIPKYISIHGLILVEGELDVIFLWQSGLRNVVSVGSLVSDIQRSLIVRIKPLPKLVCFFDKDKAGKGARDIILDAFADSIPVSYTDHPSQMDPASLPPSESLRYIKEAVSSHELWIPKA